MKYSCEPSKWFGSSIPAGMPIDVKDAGGNIIDNDWIVYFDTDTGVVISSVRDKLDNPVLSLSGEPKYKVEIFRAPLSWAPHAKPKLFVPRGM